MKKALTILSILGFLFIFDADYGHTSGNDDGGRMVVEGTIFDAETNDPIPFATVRVLGTGKSTLANDDGQYRLVLHGDGHNLKFSHVSHYSEEMQVSGPESISGLDIHLRSNLVNIGEFKVYTRAYDPGQMIILEAIKRKEDILTKIHDYRYDAYIKLNVTDESKEDSTEILLLTETQTTAYWEYPDKYKEVITARRQSSNLDAEDNLVTVGNILNFNQNRLEIGPYSMVTPTADDALNHYNYYLVDTVLFNDNPVFVLEIEPKNPNLPLFKGSIYIADSTYDVVQVEVEFSDGVDFPMIVDPKYSQRFAQFEDEYWMPIEIKFSAKFKIDVPLPSVPDLIGLSHTASLYDYVFDVGYDDVFDEYALEVAEAADDYDSTAWFARQTIPLTADEIEGYARIDSIENVPPSVKDVVLGATFASLMLASGEAGDFFRFNRVEGPYVGIGLTRDRLIKDTEIRFKTGYAIDAKRWEHQFGVTHRFHRKQKLDLGFDVFSRIKHRPALFAGEDDNSTFFALWDQTDQFDYYRTRGIELFGSVKLLDHTRLKLTYHDSRDFSIHENTDFSFFGDDTLAVRRNPGIREGKLRSISADFSFDSRSLFSNKGRDVIIDDVQYSQLKIGVEYASPDLIGNDFDYTRYFVSAKRRQRTLGLGVTTFNAYAGGSEGTLPPQRYFSVDFSDPVLATLTQPQTLDQESFGGSRVLALSFRHQFRRRLWVQSGIPVIKDIPFWLGVHGGVFWTDFENHVSQPEDDLIRNAGKPYRELGFSIGNLTPFIAPLNLALGFTWQLSDYDTSDYSVMFGFEF